jgi:hypothetical protein
VQDKRLDNPKRTMTPRKTQRLRPLDERKKQQFSPRTGVYKPLDEQNVKSGKEKKNRRTIRR